MLHFFYLFFVQPTGSGDGDLLFPAGALIERLNTEDTVGVDIKGDFNLGQSAWCWQNAIKGETPQCSIIVGHWAFALKDMNLDTGLIIGRGAETLTLRSRNSGITRDKRGGHGAQCFDTQGKWGDIKE